MNNLVSAVITTCKREPQVVCRAAKSVLAQTFSDIELIVVDDSPSDYPQRQNVKNAVCALSDKIRYVQHEVNQGACAARNTGLRLAQGEFIAYLDDDDEWLPEKIEKQLAVLQQNPDTAMVYCARIIYHEDTGNTVTDTLDPAEPTYENLIKANLIGSTSFPLIRRSCLQEVGGFDIEMKSAQDYDAWLRLAQKYPLCRLDEPLVIYHKDGADQISVNPKKKIDGLNRINEKNKDYLDAHPDVKHLRMLKLTSFYALDHELITALKLWGKASLIKPFEIKSNLGYLVNILKYYRRSNPKNKKP